MNSNVLNELDNLKSQFQTMSKLDNQWVLQASREGFTYHSKLNPANELYINRVEILVKGIKFQKLESFFGNVCNRSLVDPSLQSKEVFNNGEFAITYGRSKSPVFIINDRDFLIASKNYKLGPGETLCITKSTTLPSHQPINGVIRAEMHYNFYHLKQKNDNVLFMYLGHADPKGNLPKFLIRKGTAQYSADYVKTIEYIRNHDIKDKQ